MEFRKLFEKKKHMGHFLREIPLVVLLNPGQLRSHNFGVDTEVFERIHGNKNLANVSLGQK